MVEVRMPLCSARTSDLASLVGGQPSCVPFTFEDLGQHPPSSVASTASSWIQCSWILRRWTTLTHTVTSRRSSWRSARRSVSGLTPSGTSSSPCRVSGGEQAGGGGNIQVMSLGHQGWRLHLSKHLVQAPTPGRVGRCAVSALLSKCWLHAALDGAAVPPRGRARAGSWPACLPQELFLPRTHPQCCPGCSRMWRRP